MRASSLYCSATEFQRPASTAPPAAARAHSPSPLRRPPEAPSLAPDSRLCRPHRDPPPLLKACLVRFDPRPPLSLVGVSQPQAATSSRATRPAWPQDKETTIAATQPDSTTINLACPRISHSVLLPHPGSDSSNLGKAEQSHATPIWLTHSFGQSLSACHDVGASAPITDLLERTIALTSKPGRLTSGALILLSPSSPQRAVLLKKETAASHLFTSLGIYQNHLRSVNSSKQRFKDSEIQILQTWCSSSRLPSSSSRRLPPSPSYQLPATLSHPSSPSQRLQ